MAARMHRSWALAVLLVGCGTTSAGGEPQVDSSVDSGVSDASDVGEVVDAPADGACGPLDIADLASASPPLMPARCSSANCTSLSLECDGATGRCTKPAGCAGRGFCPCDPFGTDCGAGLRCLQGKCGPVGSKKSFESCGRPEECVLGLTCVLGRCVPAECGVTAAAPKCPTDHACLLSDDGAGQCVPLCRAAGACASCAASETCTFVGGRDHASAGSIGVCVGWGTGPFPGPGEACTAYCRAGFDCVDGECAPRCDDAAGCAVGTVCLPNGGPGGLGTCRVGCDPFDAASCSVCQPFTSSGKKVEGWCDHLDPTVGFDEPCGACRSSLTCPWGLDRRCRKLCDAMAGSTHGCADGLPCLARADESFGYCPSGCDPWKPLGAQGCADGAWCLPVTRDASTGQLLGDCVTTGEWPIGGSCYCEGYVKCRGCVAGAVCGKDAFCRAICDPEWSKSGHGACPSGQTCSALDGVVGQCL